MANGRGKGFSNGSGSRSVSRIQGGTTGGNLSGNGRKGRKWDSGNGTSEGRGGSGRGKRSY